MSSTTGSKRTLESQHNNPPETLGGNPSLPNTEPNKKDAPINEERSAENATRTAGAAAEVIRNLTQRVADQAQAGLHAVVGVQAPLADVSLSQGRRLMEITTSVTGICHEAARRSGDDMLAVTESFNKLGVGLQTYQRAYLDILSRSTESISLKQNNMMHADSPVKLAEIQRDIYIGIVNSMFAGSTALLQIAGQIAQDAARPLQERALAHKKI
jgi:hypothetical protein